MPYSIVLSDGSLLGQVADQSINTSLTSLSLIGKGVNPPYGGVFNDNLVYLMEHFASTGAPSNPIRGQLWYDLNTDLFKGYTGTQWNPIGDVAFGMTSAAVGGGLTIGGLVSSSNRRAGATGVILTHGSNNTTIGVLLSEGNIIAATSTETIPYINLPGQVSIDGINYTFATQFTGGLVAGINLTTNSGFVFSGPATSIQSGDVAERYLASESLEAGDVVQLGGINEIQKTTSEGSLDVFGVISTNPGVKMNASAGDDSTHPYVALVGRVPCKVTGTVNKFDYLVSSSTPGVAMSANGGSFSQFAYIGRALTSKITTGLGVVEIAIK